MPTGVTASEGVVGVSGLCAIRISFFSSGMRFGRVFSKVYRMMAMIAAVFPHRPRLAQETIAQGLKGSTLTTVALRST
jgi:hypothetical protein